MLHDSIVPGTTLIAFCTSAHIFFHSHPAESAPISVVPGLVCFFFSPYAHLPSESAKRNIGGRSAHPLRNSKKLTRSWHQDSRPHH